MADVIGSANELLKRELALDEAVAEAIDHFAELEKDKDDGPLLWLAIAHLQWTYGSVTPSVLDRVRKDIRLENGLERWREEPEVLTERKAALTRFLAQIEQPNPEPSTLPEVEIREAPFRKGDCLAVLLRDGKYTACLVLKVDNKDREHGMNLVVGLDYYDSEPPTVSVFRSRKWLYKTWGSWNNELEICWYLPNGFAEMRNRISVVDTIRIRWTDPRKCNSYTGWEDLGASAIYSRPGYEGGE